MRRNVPEALKWYRRASQNCSSSADNNIGIIYAERGNLRLAIKWLKRAISKGEVASAVMLGKLYAAGGPFDRKILVANGSPLAGPSIGIRC